MLDSDSAAQKNPVLSLYCGPKRRECESCVFWVGRDQGGHYPQVPILEAVGEI